MGVILFHVSTIQGSSSLSSGKSGTPWNLKFILGVSARSSQGRSVVSYFSNCLREVNFSHTFCRDRPCWGKATHVIDKLINGATRLLSLRLPVLRSQHEVPKFYNGHNLEFSWTLPRYFLLLSRLKKQWAAWSIWIGNPAIATGLLLHEVIVWCIWVSYMSENGSYNLQRHIHRRSSRSTLK